MPVRCVGRRLSIVALTLSLLNGCAPSSGPPSSDEVESTAETVVVTLALRGGAVEALSLRPGSGPLAQPPTRGAILRWELVDTDGQVIAEGKVEDPRALRSEGAVDGEDHEDDAARGDVGVLTLHLPNEPGYIRLLEPVGGELVELGQAPMPRLEGTRESALIDASRDLVGQPTVIQASQSSSAIDLLIVAEGYTEGELAKFRQDAAALTTRLMAQDGYSKHKAKIRVHRQDVNSTHSGIADPVLKRDPVTAFELSFGNDGARPRRCVMFEPSVGAAALAAIRARREAVGAEAVVILANHDEYGGCASPATGVVTVTRHAESAGILAHELGHTLFKLSDEYDGNRCDYYEDGPNVSSDLDHLPWASMLTTSTLPTPLSASSQTVGAFLGANHCTTGAYRPSKTCKMRDLGSPFCAVCKAQIDRYFSLASSGSTGAITLRNQTGGDVFVRCPDQEGPSCSGWTLLGSGAEATLRTTSPGFGVIVDTTTIDDPGVDLEQKLITPKTSSATLYANESDPLRP
ncbi:MAG: hypothetical protein IPG04_10175 [Polyangiaceae bacterium]|nr:hypothetical protein [Polyangiaceae bacterium]